MENLEQKTIAKINQVSILMIENGEKMIPVHPICDALGIEFNGQLERINRHEILSPTVRVIRTVASDKKEREMTCIPLKFVFGWLFTIQANRVKDEAKEFVLKYQTECYEALYRHFTDHTNFLEQKQKITKSKNDEIDLLKKDFNHAKSNLEEAKKQFKDAMDYPFEEWLANDRQLKLEFE